MLTHFLACRTTNLRWRTCTKRVSFILLWPTAVPTLWKLRGCSRSSLFTTAWNVLPSPQRIELFTPLLTFVEIARLFLVIPLHDSLECSTLSSNNVIFYPSPHICGNCQAVPGHPSPRQFGMFYPLLKKVKFLPLSSHF
jgi:hypothetical protein